MKEPQLPDKIITFLGLLPSTLFIFGSTFIVLHQLSQIILTNTLFFISGVTLICISFVFWLFSFLFGYLKIIYFKIKYPLKKLNDDFFLVSFNGIVCLLDNKKHEIRWIKNWQTALDLEYVGEWTDIKLDIKQPSTLSSTTVYKTKDGHDFILKRFNYVNGILTRGTPMK